MASSANDTAAILDRTLNLATAFSTCIDSLTLIHANPVYSRPQKLSLASLGIEQGRLLVVGDILGISSPPAHIATHMVPSRPGALNPDPNEPVNFGVRDSRLDDEAIRSKIEETITAITDRPSSLTREEMMATYGVKPSKRGVSLCEPSLCNNRVEAFREKYGILKDLIGYDARARRGMSMASQHWDIADIGKFEGFIQLVRQQVNTLIELLDVQEQVDRGINVDIKSMGWHPDITAPLVRRDWDKLRLIQEACREDYPQYIQSTQTAIEFLTQCYREAYRPYDPVPKKQTTKLDNLPVRPPTQPPAKLPVSSQAASKKGSKRPGWLKAFRLGSFGKDAKNASTAANTAQAQAQVLNEGTSTSAEPDDRPFSPPMDPERSKSLPGPIPEQITSIPLQDENEGKTSDDQYRQDSVQTSPTSEEHSDRPPMPANVERVDTYNSMIDRHDKFPGIGRMETKDARDVAHGWHN